MFVELRGGGPAKSPEQGREAMDKLLLDRRLRQVLGDGRGLRSGRRDSALVNLGGDRGPRACCRIRRAGPPPKHLGDLDRIQSQAAPPRPLIAGTMSLPVMQAAERDGELVAHPATQRPLLGEAQVV